MKSVNISVIDQAIPKLNEWQAEAQALGFTITMATIAIDGDTMTFAYLDETNGWEMSS